MVEARVTGGQRTITRLTRSLGHSRVVIGAGHSRPPDQVAVDDTLAVPTGRATMLIAAEEILWLESLDNYSRVHRSGAPPLTVRRSLAEWEEILSAESFFRLDHSLIVSLDQIDAIHWRWPRGTQLASVGCEETLTIGRAATRRLKDRLDGGC